MPLQNQNVHDANDHHHHQINFDHDDGIVVDIVGDLIHLGDMEEHEHEHDPHSW